MVREKEEGAGQEMEQTPPGGLLDPSKEAKERVLRGSVDLDIWGENTCGK